MAYDIPSISDLEATQLLNKHYAEVVTSKKDGIASGSDITQTTNPITGVTRRTLYKILDDAQAEHDNQMQSFENNFDSRLAGMAFTRVGTFTAGATLTDMRQTLLWEVSQGGDGHEYGWAGTFPKVVAAGSTPATAGGIGALLWVDRTDLMLRSELTINGTSIEDLSLINTNSGASKVKTSSGETVEQATKEAVRIQFFGGIDDGATDCAVAIANAKAAGVSQLVIRKSISGTGVFYFSGLTDTTFSGITLYCDDNVTLNIPSYEVYSNLVPITLYGNPTIYGRDVNRGYKSAGSTTNGIERLAKLKIDESTTTRLKTSQLVTGLYTLTSDTVTAASFTTPADNSLFFVGATGNNIGFAGYPIEVGEAISFNHALSTESGQQWGFGITTETSFYFAYTTSGALGTLILNYKVIGNSNIVGSVQIGPVDSYWPPYAEISLLKIDDKTIRYVVNGISVPFMLPDISLNEKIINVGAVYRQNSTSVQSELRNIRVTKNPSYGLHRFNLVTYGDSITADYINDWPSLAIDVLNGNGCDIKLLANYAVAGENSWQQYQRLLSNGVGAGNLFIIAVGTNDIQGQLGAAAMVNNITKMLGIISSVGAKAIVAIPPMYISKSMGGGTGTDTSSYQLGAEYRTLLIDYCLKNSIPFFEPQNSQSYMFDINSTWHRDNIHPSALGVMSYAWDASVAIVKALSRKPVFSSTALPFSFFNGTVGWPGLTPRSALSSDGKSVKLSGLLKMNAVNITNGLKIANINPKHKPLFDKYIPITGSNTSMSAGHLLLNTSGELFCYNVTQAPVESWISLDGISFEL